MAKQLSWLARALEFARSMDRGSIPHLTVEEACTMLRDCQTNSVRLNRDGQLFTREQKRISTLICSLMAERCPVESRAQNLAKDSNIWTDLSVSLSLLLASLVVGLTTLALFYLCFNRERTGAFDPPDVEAQPPRHGRDRKAERERTNEQERERGQETDAPPIGNQNMGRRVSARRKKSQTTLAVVRHSERIAQQRGIGGSSMGSSHSLGSLVEGTTAVASSVAGSQGYAEPGAKRWSHRLIRRKERG